MDHDQKDTMNRNRQPWTLVVMLMATATASYISRVNVSTAGPLIMEEFGLTQVQMGTVFSAFLLGYVLFQIPAGLLADRWGAANPELHDEGRNHQRNGGGHRGVFRPAVGVICDQRGSRL